MLPSELSSRVVCWPAWTRRLLADGDKCCNIYLALIPTELETSMTLWPSIWGIMNASLKHRPLLIQIRQFWVREWFTGSCIRTSPCNDLSILTSWTYATADRSRFFSPLAPKFTLLPFIHQLYKHNATWINVHTSNRSGKIHYRVQANHQNDWMSA